MKKVIAYGAGGAFRNFIKNNKHKFLFVIDNNLDTESIEGIKVYKSEYLKYFLSENKEDIFIIIFAMSSRIVKNISEELINLGLKYGKDFNEYSFLLKDSFKDRFKKYDINLSENTYEFARNLFRSLDIENQSSVLGSWVVLSLIDKTRGLDGSIVELGVYKGGNAYYSCLYKTAIGDNREYFLLDSFDGFNEYSSFDPKELKGMFKDNSYEYVKKLFENFQTAKVVKGFIPNVLNQFNETDMSIIYYDCDTYESCKQSLNMLYPRLQKKGYFIIHDYEAKQEGFIGVKKAVDEYITSIGCNNLNIINIPETTHIILQKL